MNHIFLFLAGAFALGGIVILAAMLLPSCRGTARMLWRFYLSEFLIVSAFLLPAAIGGWAFLLLLLAMAARGQWELLDLHGWRLSDLLPIVALLTGMGLLVLPPSYLPETLTVAVALLAVASVAQCRRFNSHAVAPAASLLFPVLPLIGMSLLRQEIDGFFWLFMAYAVVEANDSFALLIGKLAGRRRILPRLSPGKTLEGFVAGLAAGTTAGFVIAHYLIGLDPFAAIFVTLIVLTAGNAGDLLLSAIKRVHEVKDFQPLAKLHGGLLDIYDSLLFAVPAVLLARTLI